MARRKIYTAEDAKFVKHLRNKMYYLNRKLADWNYKYMMAVTFKNIRDQLSEDEAYALLDIFSDDDLYYVKDFRQVAIDEGDESTRNFIDAISRRLGYGSIDAYEQKDTVKQDAESALESTKFIYDEFRRLAKG